MSQLARKLPRHPIGVLWSALWLFPLDLDNRARSTLNGSSGTCQK
jgi:hypothetical protein